MQIRTAAVSIVVLVALCQFFGMASRADDLPLPERNPLRVIDLPLPERNPERVTPERTASLPLPERNPLRTTPEPEIPEERAKPPRWPKTLPEKSDKPEILKTWTEEETAAERSRCEAILKDLAAVVAPADPVRSGGCGSAAPYKLSRIGTDPEVQVSPPATVTCDVIAAMVQWMNRDVQPAARRILGAPVTKLNVVSDYSCRNAPFRTSTRLSEHALANALDIRDFVTAKGEIADLKRDWGPTARDIAARLAAEKAAAAAGQAAEAAAAEAAAKAVKAAREAKSKVAKVDADKAAPATVKDAADELPPPLAVIGSAGGEATGRKLSRAEVRRARREARRIKVASHLGGPAIAAGEGVLTPLPPPPPTKRDRKSRRAALPAPQAPAPATAQTSETPRALFLREIHARACDHFGTVLGPEANDAHRDHFHVDMAKRRHRSFCE